MQRVYSSSEEEDAAIQEFVRLNPFPSRKTMMKRMEKDVTVWAEYGAKNHNAIRMCYEHITDKATCINMGKLIYERGGDQAMVMNYYALLRYSPFQGSTDIVIRTAPTLVSHWWNGIGHWMD